MLSPCVAISDKFGELFSCSELEGRVRIRTPFLYPDGDVIDLFYDERGTQPTLTDLGETLRWLRGQTVSRRRSPKQQQLIEDICVNHGIEFFRGMLMVRVRQLDDLASAVTRLAQAALRVADIWFTLRTRAVESLADEVEDYLKERDVLFARDERIVGRSGKVWRPDFHARLPHRSSLIYVLATGSRGAASTMTKHVVTSWVDLNHLQVGPEALAFVSLLDDTSDVWTIEDINLLADLSEVAFWSRPEEFLEKLAA